MEVNIRRAAPEDLPALSRMADAMRKESPRYAAVSFSPERMTAMLQAMLSSVCCAVFVAEESGAVVGMIGMMSANYFFSDERYACDLAVYVIPERRGGRAGLALVRAAESWAKAQGVREICLGVSAGIDAERVGGFYRVLGYEKVSSGYVKPCAS